MPLKFKIYFTGIALLTAFYGCTSDEKPGEKKISDSQSVVHSDSARGKTIPQHHFLPRNLVLNKKGQPIDTLDKLTVSWLRKQYGKPSSFPGGLASLQNELPDSIIANCGTRKNSAVKFKPTSRSLFDSLNTENIYVGLLHETFSMPYYGMKDPIDFDDCDYSLLRFLRYRFLTNRYSVKVADSSEEYVNMAACRTMNYLKPLSFYAYAENKVYPLKLDYWKEFWECEERADYAPTFPYLGISGTMPQGKFPSVKKDNYSDDTLWTVWETNPQFIPFIFPLNDSALLFHPDSLSGEVKETTMETENGKKITGSGIDLNHDNINDIFWYKENRNSGYSGYSGWICWMYLNIGGKWECVWYRIHNSL